MKEQPLIADYMTRSPHSIGAARTLEDAHRLMRQHKIRHLPVVDQGVLVGIVSERDLALAETLKDVDPRDVEVEEAMSPDPYVVSPDTPLQKVAITMWKKKYGSAVVMEGREVVGVFTTIDALRALITGIEKWAKKPTKKPTKKKSPPRTPTRKRTSAPAKKRRTRNA
jgi:acetoin utilization protein AcuB